MDAGSDLGPDDYRVTESRVVAIHAAIALGDLDGAEALIARSGVDRTGQRRHFQLAHAMRARAAIEAARGEGAGVEDARKGAIGLFREIDYPFWTAVTMYEHAAWLRDQQRETDAEPFVADARQIFTNLGATPWLDRLDALGIATSTEAVRTG